MAAQRKAVHLVSGSQRDRNKGVKTLTFRPPMAKLAAAASAPVVTEQVSGRDPKICLHWSLVCEVYGGRRVFIPCSVLFSVPFDLSLFLVVSQVQEFIGGLESGSFLPETKPLS